MNTLNLSIYVACLASYNAGILHRKWIDATQGEEYIWKKIKTLLKTSSVKDADKANEFLEDNYQAMYNSKTKFAEQLIEDEISQLPNYIQYYFDYESFPQDLFINDYLYFEIDYEIHVFRNG